ncbi:MAG: hypothetical protein ACON5B_01625 [Myxococcota bacterium]
MSVRWMWFATMPAMLTVACDGGDGNEPAGNYTPEVTCTVGFADSVIDATTVRQEYDQQGRILFEGPGDDRMAEGAVTYDWAFAGQTAEAVTITTYGAKGVASIRELEFEEHGHLTFASLDEGADGKVEQMERRTLTLEGSTVREAAIDWMDDGSVQQVWSFREVGEPEPGYTATNAAGNVVMRVALTPDAAGRILVADVYDGDDTLTEMQQWTWGGDILEFIDTFEPRGFQDGPVRRELDFDFLFQDTDLPSSVKRRIDRGDDGSDDRLKVQDFVYEGDCSSLGADRVWGPDYDAEFKVTDPLRFPVEL